MSDLVIELIQSNKRIKKLELEVRDLRRELQGIRERLEDMASSHDKFGPVKMKEEPCCPF